jgi:hypothetical protein
MVVLASASVPHSWGDLVVCCQVHAGPSGEERYISSAVARFRASYVISMTKGRLTRQKKTDVLTVSLTWYGSLC